MRPTTGINTRSIRLTLNGELSYRSWIHSMWTGMEAFGAIVAPFAAKDMLLIQLQSILQLYPVRQRGTVDLRHDRKGMQNEQEWDELQDISGGWFVHFLFQIHCISR